MIPTGRGSAKLLPPRGKIPALPGEVRILAKEGRRPTDYLNDSCIRGESEGVGHVLWLRIILAPEPDLHQLAGPQRIVE